MNKISKNGIGLKILQKIIGSKRNGGKETVKCYICKLRGFRVLSGNTKFAFYGHLVGMNPERLTNRTFVHFDKNLKTNVRCFIEVKKDLAQMNKHFSVVKERI